MMRVIGLEMGRRLCVAPAAELHTWTAKFDEPWVAFIALDARERTDADLRILAHTLIDAGCVYSVTWGPNADRMDVTMDFVSIETEEAGGLHVMTDDFYGDPLVEALWYAVFCTWSADAEVTSLVAVVDDEFLEEIERYLSDTARLDADYSAFDDARVAAEESARPRRWIGRLRKKLAVRR